MSVALYQIYYKPEHLSKLYPFAKPYLNEHLTIFFENTPISKLVMETKAEKIGVTSWKLQEKMRSRVGLRVPLTQEVLNSEYCILSLTKNSLKHQMMGMANTWHKDFLPTIKLLWSKLGYNMPGEAKHPIYQNAYLAKTEIYKSYVNEFLIPAMELTLNDEEMNKKMTQVSGYGTLSRGADLKSVKEKLNIDDYPMSCFILERCPSLWFTMKKINVTYL